MLFRIEDEFGESLDSVGRVFGEEGVECAGYGTEEVLDLGREVPRRGIDVWRRILFVRRLR